MPDQPPNLMSRKRRSIALSLRNESASSALSKVASRSRKGSCRTYPTRRSRASGSSSTMMQRSVIEVDRKVNGVGVIVVRYFERVTVRIEQHQAPSNQLVAQTAMI